MLQLSRKSNEIQLFKLREMCVYIITLSLTLKDVFLHRFVKLRLIIFLPPMLSISSYIWCLLSIAIHNCVYTYLYGGNCVDLEDAGRSLFFQISSFVHIEETPQFWWRVPGGFMTIWVTFFEDSKPSILPINLRWEKSWHWALIE